MDYNKILDAWAEKVFDKADRAKERADDASLGSYKAGLLQGYCDGLYMAVAILSVMERKAKRCTTTFGS